MGDVIRMTHQAVVDHTMVRFLNSRGYYFIPENMPEYPLYMRGILTMADLLVIHADRVIFGDGNED